MGSPPFRENSYAFTTMGIRPLFRLFVTKCGGKEATQVRQRNAVPNHISNSVAGSARKKRVRLLRAANGRVLVTLGAMKRDKRRADERR